MQQSYLDGNTTYCAAAPSGHMAHTATIIYMYYTHSNTHTHFKISQYNLCSYSEPFCQWQSHYAKRLAPWEFNHSFSLSSISLSFSAFLSLNLFSIIPKGLHHTLSRSLCLIMHKWALLHMYAQAFTHCMKGNERERHQSCTHRAQMHVQIRAAYANDQRECKHIP